MIETNLATQGLPALSPQIRSRAEIIKRTRAQDRENLKRDIANNEVTVARDGEIDTSNTLAQLGHPLSSQQLIDRLRKANPSLLFERSVNFPEHMGIYLANGEEKQFVCGFEAGFMPEFSVLHAIEKRVPDPDVRGHWQTVKTFSRETRGWRTVLARLLRMRLITEPQINRLFDFSRSSAKWKAATT